MRSPGAPATNDRHPGFPRTIETGTFRPAPFDVVIVHPFSGFIRDYSERECRGAGAKVGVRLVSIAWEMGDDPTNVVRRQIVPLLGKYRL
jgi:site-specific DNA recombinase